MPKPKANRGRQSNAWKHGAFATELFIFKEDVSEFQELHNGLTEELKPSGRMEEEIVLEIAKLRWRKRRIEKFYVHEADFLRAHPGEEGLEKLGRILTTLMKGMPCEAVWEQIKRLPAPMYEAFDAAVKPPTKKIDDEWLEQLKKIGNYILLRSDREIQYHQTSARFLSESAVKLMDLSAKRIAIEERLDAMLDRALKRLAQIKTYKQVLATQEACTPRTLRAG